jgi:hypothetical protein
MAHALTGRARHGLLAVALLAASLTGAATTAVHAADGPAAFDVLASPPGLADWAGEPSIGIDWKTGAVLFQAETKTLKVAIDGSTAPAQATWTDVSPALTSQHTEDPILFTDSALGHTIVSQLTVACSLGGITDDDGATWVQHPALCAPGAAFDHQSVGGGPFATTRPALAPHAVYYCAQASLSAQCGASRDGGLTFGPAVPIYPATSNCIGIHGHIKVAPDGTVYVPFDDCDGMQGVAVSHDDGLTWSIHEVPGVPSYPAVSDPSVAIGTDGTVYFSAPRGDVGSDEIVVAVSHDRAETWTPPVVVDHGFGLMNTIFPAGAAGDGDRAAVAFLGTATGGDISDAAFGGVWHLFVSSTTDGGATWTTADVTGSDPVQRGCIDLGGFPGTRCRNLLDFIDAGVDAQGRVLVAFADGCVDACVSGAYNTRLARATIARQSGGTLLFRTPQA